MLNWRASFFSCIFLLLLGSQDLLQVSAWFKAPNYKSVVWAQEYF